MKINRVVLGGVFTFPHGDAAGARIRDLALGFKECIGNVKVVSAFINNNENVNNLSGTINFEEVGINYDSIINANSIKNSSNFFDRLSARFLFIKLNKQLSKKIVENLNGTEGELLFLYGRSYLFLNAVLKRIKNKNFKTKVLFDVVEPPKITHSVFEYISHPFIIDSVLAYTFLLKKFNACTFISQKLFKVYGKQVSKSAIIPSATYKKNSPQLLQTSTKSQVIQLGYLGALLNKDYPSLMYNLCEELFLANIKFQFTILGRFKNFSEGRSWEQKFTTAKFASQINFISNPSEEEKIQVLNKIDFLLLLREPSLLQEYTFPTRVPELLSLQKVLIVNDFGDFSLYFKNKINSIVIHEETLKKDVYGILNCTEISTYNKVVQSAQNLLVTDFNATVHATKILKLFES